VSSLRSASRSRSSLEQERLERRNQCCKRIRPRYAHELNRIGCIVIYCYNLDCMVANCYSFVPKEKERGISLDLRPFYNSAGWFSLFLYKGENFTVGFVFVYSVCDSSFCVFSFLYKGENFTVGFVFVYSVCDFSFCVFSFICKGEILP
jgi:hypothetical protein